MKRRGFASKTFGNWLNHEIATRKTSANQVALKAGVGAHCISRMRHGLSAPEASVRRVMSTLGYPEPEITSLLIDFLPEQIAGRSQNTARENWEHLCIALQIIGHYSSVDEALKTAISREIASTTSKPPTTHI